MRPKAIVLVSGGLDSATVLSVAASTYDVHALSFRYGQRHAIELECAREVVAATKGVADHKVVDIDLRLFGGSALTDDIEVPKDGPTGGIPVTYVPARNTIFLSYALGWAEVIGAKDIFIGANAVDYSGYPDCRPEFIRAFEALANAATKNGPYRIKAPLISLTKAQIIKVGANRGVDFSITSSCYDPVGGSACGVCDSCRIRRRGFEEAGIVDPTRYAHDAA